MKKKKILVAMSGGVDSSVAALLLLNKGYDVTGVSLKLFEQSKCCGVRGIQDARNVAAQIGIPFYAINCMKEFEKTIIRYFCNSYENGITPNPCVPCNSSIKFGWLLKKARALGISHIATGHYARTGKKDGKWVLKKGKYPDKDQSYFLCRLTKEQLAAAVFPLGDYSKTEVRRIAKENKLKVHDKPGSQEICFIPDDDYKGFLSSRGYKSRPGAIVDTEGKVLGEHRGIAFYTIGQRSGLGISHKTPLYVIAIDRERNTVVVGSNDETYSSELIAGDVNWLVKPVGSIRAKVKIRYRHLPGSAVVTRLDRKKARVRFREPQRSVTPGQSVVFYCRNTVIGGGIIIG